MKYFINDIEVTQKEWKEYFNKLTPKKGDKLIIKTK